MKARKRAFGWIMTMLMVFSVVPVMPTVVMADTGPSKTIYVVTSGNDAIGNGTQASPYQTLAKAKEEVRTLPKSGGDIVVEIADGFYPLEETLIFDENDSGSATSRVRYVAAPGANPVISGGQMIKGDIWEATTVNNGVTAYKTTLQRDDKLRAIYVNGVRAEMTQKKGVPASSANDVVGYYKVTMDGTNSDWAWRNTEEIVMDTYRTPIGVNGHAKGNMIDSTNLPANAKNPRNIEFETGSTWVKQRICIDSLEQGTGGNATKTIAYFQMPYAAIAQNPGWGTAYSPTKEQTIYNVFEWLSKPGEFYFDQAEDTLYYIPRAGENMSTAEVSVPKLETLIEVQGSKAKQNYAQFISFEGLTFAHSDWNLNEIEGSSGNVTTQGATFVKVYTHGNQHYDMYRSYDIPPAAIHMTTAHDIKVLAGQVINTGSIGVHIENDVFDIELVGNNISYTGGAGLVVGHPTHIYENDGEEHQVKRWNYPDNNTTRAAGLVGQTIPTAGPDKDKFTGGTEGIPRDILIKNNFFTTNCLMFPSHNTITTFYTRRLQVVNNFVFDSTYGGLSIGWGWCNFDGSPASETDDNQLPGIPTETSKENTISYNRVENVCTQLADSGGIYTLGKQGDPGYENASHMSNNYINVIRDFDIWRANKGSDGNHDWVNGFHPDEGSAWIKFDSNVVENVIRSVFEFNTWKRKHSMEATNTYSNKRNPENGAPNTTLDLKLHEDSVWPVEGYEVVLESGLEDAYKHWIPESVVSKADLEFVSHVRVSPDVIELRKGGRFTSQDKVWFVPVGTNIAEAELLEGATMTMASGDAKTIEIPSEKGIYEFYIIEENGTAKKSQYKLYVDESSEPEGPKIKTARSNYGTPEVHTGTIADLADFDKIWDTAQTITSSNFVEGKADVTGAAIGKVKTLWDEQYLYILMDIEKLSGTLSKTGTSPHLHDSVELFIEEQNVRDGSYQASSGQYRIDYENDRTYGSGGSSEAAKQNAIKSATYIRPDGSGYIIEAAIPFTTQPGPTLGKIIGFDAQVNGANGADRTSVSMWSDLTGGSWNSNTEWGKLTLVKDSIPMEGLDLWLKADDVNIVTDENDRVLKWENLMDGKTLTPVNAAVAGKLMRAEGELVPYDYIMFDSLESRLEGNILKDYNGREEMTIIVVTQPTVAHNDFIGFGDKFSAVHIDPTGDWGGAGITATTDGVHGRFGNGMGPWVGPPNNGEDPVIRSSASINSLVSIIGTKNKNILTLNMNNKDGEVVNDKDQRTRREQFMNLGTTLTVGGVLNNESNNRTEENAFKGRVAEILIYDRVLSGDELESINTYITSKYFTEREEDTTVPTWPRESTLTTTGISSTGLTLKWTAAQDDTSVTGYRIYKGTDLLATVARDVRSYHVTGLTQDTAYTFKVEAGDAGDNWSTNGPSKAVKTVEDIVVTIPTQGLDLWLKADRGVETDANGKVTGWTNQVLLENELQPRVLTSKVPGSEPALRHEAPETGSEYHYVQFDTYANRLVNEVFTLGGGSPNLSKYSGAREMTIISLILPEDIYVGQGGDQNTINGDRRSVVSFNDNGNWGGAGLSAGSNIVSSRFGHGTGNPSPITRLSQSTPINKLSSIMIIKNDENESIYINGDKGVEATGKGSPLAGIGNTLTIGGSMDTSTGGQNESFKGRVAEVLIYDRVLSEDELESVNTYITNKYFTEPIEDTTAPIWPQESTLTASNVSSTGLKLTWTAAQDDIGVTNYRIYKETDRLETVTGNEQSYDVTGLSQDTAYTFTVRAGDAVGNWTTTGPAITIRTLEDNITPIEDTTAPTWPQESNLIASDVSSTGFKLTWTAAQDDIGVTNYRIYKETDRLATVAGNVQSYHVTGLSQDTAYTFTVRAGDAVGNWTTTGPAITIRTLEDNTTPIEDTTAPTWTQGSNLTASNVSSTALKLTWTAAQDDTSVTGYRIYKGTDLLATVAAHVLSYNVTALTQDTDYTFRIEAGDIAGNWSTNGSVISVTTSKRSQGGGGGSISRPRPTPTPTPAPVTKVIAMMSLTSGLASRNGEKLTLYVKPYIQNGRTMVGVRDIATLLNVDSKNIIWDAKNKSVLIKTADKEIYLVIGQLYAVVNGEKVEIDVAPQTKDSRTVLPIAHIARILGIKAEYNANTKEVTLSIE